VRHSSVLVAACLALLAAAPSAAQVATAPRGERFVPWTVLNPGVVPPQAPLVLYWIPLSRDEMRNSELVTSRELAVAAGHCVSLQVIRPDDFARVSRYRERSPLPIAVLTDATGAELARADSVRGLLPAGALASLILDELRTRSRAADEALRLARARQVEGDLAAAQALYRDVAAAGCLAPRQSKLAAKALKKLTAR
jgi:hypothetical protein